MVVRGNMRGTTRGGIDVRKKSYVIGGRKRREKSEEGGKARGRCRLEGVDGIVRR